MNHVYIYIYRLYFCIYIYVCSLMGLETTVTFSIMGTQPIFKHLSMAVDGGNLTKTIGYKDHSKFWIPWGTP